MTLIAPTSLPSEIMIGKGAVRFTKAEVFLMELQRVAAPGPLGFPVSFTRW